MIEHARDDCTGEWITSHNQKWIYCETCGAAEHFTPERSDAALVENTIGWDMERMADKGKRMLDAEGV